MFKQAFRVTAVVTAVGLAAAIAPPAGAAGGGKLKATAPGVTAKSIKVAFPSIDFEKLKSVGVNLDRGDYGRILSALAADVDVNGRKLDAVEIKFNVLNPADAEAACVKMTEDLKVFAAISSFVGPAAAANKCIVDRKTVLLTGSPSGAGSEPDPAVAATTTWLMREASARRSSEILVGLLKKKGVLKGKTIGVVTPVADQETTNTVLVPALKKAGTPAKIVIVDDQPGTDVAAFDAAWQVYAEKLKAAGVNHVILMGGVAGRGMANVFKHKVASSVSTPSASILQANGRQPGVDPSTFNGVYTIGGMTPSEAFLSAPIQKCVAAFKKANPSITVKDPAQIQSGETDWGVGITDVCNQLALFTKIATAAGPKLTNDSFRKAALKMTDSFSFGSVDYATFGPGKYDANNGFRLMVFDSTLGEFGGLKPDGDVVDLTPSRKG